MRKVRTHTFNGVKYEIDVYQPFDGLCESPTSDNNRPDIRISIDIRTRLGLISLLHECLHAENYAKGEGVVDRVSSEIGDLLWRLGFRMKDESKGKKSNNS
jgi:hypothetical protein